MITLVTGVLAAAGLVLLYMAYVFFQEEQKASAQVVDAIKKATDALTGVTPVDPSRLLNSLAELLRGMQSRSRPTHALALAVLLFALAAALSALDASFAAR
jgi:hypothetical protein